MQKNGAAIVFSVGDLVGPLNCRYLTHLDFEVAQGELAKSKLRNDPTLDAMVEGGKTLEQGFVDHLARQSETITVIAGVGIDHASVAQTGQAMARGDVVIVQAALRDGHWSGRADVLRRLETPSGLDAQSYEVTDTQLARDQGQHGPAAQPLLGPIGDHAADGPGDGPRRDSRNEVPAGGVSRGRFCGVLPMHQAKPEDLCGCAPRMTASIPTGSSMRGLPMARALCCEAAR